MGVVDDVQAYLTAQGLVDGSTSWTSRRRWESDVDVDRLVILTEDGGPPPEIAETEGIGDSAEADVGVQVRVRGQPHQGDDAAEKAKAILDQLHGQRSVTMNGTTYLRVRAQTPVPVFAGWDDRNRPNFTTSFRLLRDV